MNKLGNYLLLTLVLITLSFCSLSKLQAIRSNTSNKAGSLSDPNELSKIHSGDIILREGKSFVSQVFKNFSLTDKHYSHSGIIYVLNGKYYVCHVVAAEGNRSDKIRLEPLSSFCNPSENVSWAIYRTTVDGTKIDKQVVRFLSEKIAFDTDFSLQSNDRMYCSELVYKILTEANENKKFINLSHGSTFDYVACDNLYLNSQTRLICSHSN